MGQVLHGSATTTEAVRRAIQHSQESLRVLAKRYGINQKTVAKWKRRSSVADIPTGPKDARSTVLSVAEETIIVAFRRHTLLPLDDCLYALQPTIPHLSRSSLHRCLQRHGISQLPQVEGEASSSTSSRPTRSATSTSTSPKSAPPRASSTCSWRSTARPSSPSSNCTRRSRAVPPPTSCATSSPPCPTRSTRSSPITAHTSPPPAHQLGNTRHQGGARRRRDRLGACLRVRLRQGRHRPPPDQAKASMDQRPGRADEPHPQGGHRQALLLRDPRRAANPPRPLRPSLQLRPAPQDPQRPHPLRVHLQSLDKRASQIHPKSSPSNPGLTASAGNILCF